MTSELPSGSKKQVALILAIPVLVIAVSSVMFLLAQK